MVNPLDPLEGLDPDQREAAELPAGPVAILAGAGTGKTRTITHRIAHLVSSGEVHPDHVLAVTFTTRAAGELRARLRTLGVPGVQARTFHAAARRQLSFFWSRGIGGSMPPLVESKLRLVAEAASRSRLELRGTDLRDAASEIEWARATLTTAETYVAAAAAARREPPRPPADMARLLTAYEEAKRRAEVVDFDDLLLLLAGMLEEHRDIAEEVRAQYRHFVVDEYQDVTPLQQCLLDAWVGDRTSVTVVGDANQTIYSFTGATPTYLLRFSARFPEAHIVRLTRDYRSTPQVVELANAVIARASQVPAGARLSLVAQRPDGPKPTFGSYGSEPEEARAVVRQVQRLADAGVPLSEMAVLYRIHAQSETYEAACAAAGIAVVLRGGERFFDRPEIREAMLMLRTASRAAEPPPGDDLRGQVAEILAVTGREGWRPDAPPPGGGAARERWDNLSALASIAETHTQLAAFVAELEDRAATQHAPAARGVTLATLHAAKGLEWDAVWLVGLTDGTVPLVHAQTTAEIEEERRLLYVGITRAREHLGLSWAAARQEGGRGNRRRSRFLDGVAPAEAERPARKAARRTLVLDEGVDPELFARLRDWRKEAASELRQPAFCVFTDATLSTIAARKPRTRAELAAIPGVGAVKLDKYFEAVAGIIDGAPAVGA